MIVVLVYLGTALNVLLSINYYSTYIHNICITSAYFVSCRIRIYYMYKCATKTLSNYDIIYSSTVMGLSRSERSPFWGESCKIEVAKLWIFITIDFYIRQSYKSRLCPKNKITEKVTIILPNFVLHDSALSLFVWENRR